jgi:hypothetical protein
MEMEMQNKIQQIPRIEYKQILNTKTIGQTMELRPIKNQTKIKPKHKVRIWMVILGFVMFIIPVLSAYSVTFPAMDLYQVFVEYIFGGFWLSVFGLSGIMFIIMGLIGGLSPLTTITYCGVFVLAMAIGYTQPLIIIPLWSMILFWTITQVLRLINVQSSLW